MLGALVLGMLIVAPGRFRALHYTHEPSRHGARLRHDHCRFLFSFFLDFNFFGAVKKQINSIPLERGRLD